MQHENQMINGKLSAIRRVLGYDWDMLERSDKHAPMHYFFGEARISGFKDRS